MDKLYYLYEVLRNLFLFNLCILQAGPINKNLVLNYPSYDQMFSLLLKNKIKNWRIDTFNIYENIFPQDLAYYNGFIVTGSAFGVYENHSWIKHLFNVIKKLSNIEFHYWEFVLDTKLLLKL